MSFARIGEEMCAADFTHMTLVDSSGKLPGRSSLLLPAKTSAATL